MKHILLGLAAISLPSLAVADPAAIRDAGLRDSLAWQITEGLTTEIGPRITGSDAEARARAWGVAKLKALGFQNVRIETYMVDYWERGVESAEILGANPQKLHVTALGHSGATPAKGIEAELVGFASIAELRAAPDSAVKGKIVYITNHMAPTQDGSSYGHFGISRRQGPAIAAAKGAAALLIRSIGTDSHRLPHTGVTSWPEGTRPFPAGALSSPDADQVERLIARGPVKLRLTLTPQFLGKRESGNVIGEIPGSDPKAGVIVVGGHLDSWDLGTGALDDAVGIGITTAAAKLVGDAGQPLRTIRVVWWGSEETGGDGADDYVRRHGHELHALAAESDFGADRIWRFDTKVRNPNAAPIQRVMALLDPLGIARGHNNASGAPDVVDLGKAGVPIVSMQQDGTRYFDIHHTADDTLDKVDPAQLRQNVAAWAALLAVAAHDPEWKEGHAIPAASEPNSP